MKVMSPSSSSPWRFCEDMVFAGGWRTTWNHLTAPECGVELKCELEGGELSLRRFHSGHRHEGSL